MADGSTNSPQDDLTDTIRRTAAGPAAVNIDGNSVTAQDTLKQMAVDKHLASKAAVGKRGFGLRMAKMIPPGAV